MPGSGVVKWLGSSAWHEEPPLHCVIERLASQVW
jgi:hypothetical protein